MITYDNITRRLPFLIISPRCSGSRAVFRWSCCWTLLWRRPDQVTKRSTIWPAFAGSVAHEFHQTGSSLAADSGVQGGTSALGIKIIKGWSQLWQMQLARMIHKALFFGLPHSPRVPPNDWEFAVALTGFKTANWVFIRRYIQRSGPLKCQSFFLGLCFNMCFNPWRFVNRKATNQLFKSCWPQHYSYSMLVGVVEFCLGSRRQVL